MRCKVSSKVSIHFPVPVHTDVQLVTLDGRSMACIFVHVLIDTCHHRLVGPTSSALDPYSVTLPVGPQRAAVLRSHY